MSDHMFAGLGANVGAFDHVAFIVDDLASELARYREVFSAEVSPTETHAQYGCSSTFVHLGYCKLRIFASHGAESPIATFWGPHALGGIHHVCYLVDEIESVCGDLKRRGYRLLGTGGYKRTSRGKRMIFLCRGRGPGPLLKLEER